jgi:signal transduction histidine kinase
MRAKPSSTASGMYSRSGSFTSQIPIYAVANLPGTVPPRGEIFAYPGQPQLHSAPKGPRDEGLLHDARNLMGAIGLYCDLLSMPGVLHPEHRQYADELRLLGVRSGALIERLLQSALAHTGESANLGTSMVWDGEASCSGEAGRTIDRLQDGTTAQPCDLIPDAISKTLPKPVSLRKILERCAGLLSRVAGGRIIEVGYGEAASIPVSVDEEAIERILVNLVRNAAAALRTSAQPGDPEGDAIVGDGLGAVLQRGTDPTADETPGAIRIGVGFLVNRANDPQPWPIRRVRLTVEDSGCGMSQQQLERILYGDRAPSRGSHGIGFRVVRELVASYGGDLRVMSAQGIGTRVQIEWPVSADAAGRGSKSRQENASEQLAVASKPQDQERRGTHPSLAPRGLASSASRGTSPAQKTVALSDTRADSRAGKGRLTIC